MINNTQNAPKQPLQKENSNLHSSYNKMA